MTSTMNGFKIALTRVVLWCHLSYFYHPLPTSRFMHQLAVGG